jgi:nicotinamidase-related amidase
VSTYDAKQIRKWKARLAPYLRDAPPADPAHSALLVVDMQRYFEGIGEPAVAAIRKAVDASRELGVPVFFTQHGHARGGDDAGALGAWWSDLIWEGTADHRLLADTGYRRKDRVVAKRRYNAFFATDLADRLREHEVSDLAIAGVMTNLCVETTARDAFVRDFQVRVLMDAAATATEEMHMASLLNLAFGFAYVQTAEEWIDGLRS